MSAEPCVDIYALCDPRTGKIRYIGKANNAVKRFGQHLREIRRRHTPLYRWMRKVLAQGEVPSLLILATVGRGKWEDCERLAIAEAKRLGCDLLNLAEGGDGPSCSREVRSANAKRLNERLAQDPRQAKLRENLRRLAISLKQGYVSQATREKIRSRPDVFSSLQKYL